jgi:hypothetical protein
MLPVDGAGLLLSCEPNRPPEGTGAAGVAPPPPPPRLKAANGEVVPGYRLRQLGYIC